MTIDEFEKAQDIQEEIKGIQREIEYVKAFIIDIGYDCSTRGKLVDPYDDDETIYVSVSTQKIAGFVLLQLEEKLLNLQKQFGEL